MLTAYNQDMKYVNVLDTLPPKSASYYCPSCRSQMRLKIGKVIRPHFAHLSLKDCHYTAENESAQHLHLKASLYKWLKGEGVEIEKVLSDIQQIADVLVNGKLALEVQCSPLSIDRLRERTLAYREMGYQVLWLLGKDLWIKDQLTSLQKQFLRFSQNMGFHLWELDMKKEVLRLRYLIHEDMHGKVQCLSKEFPFYKGNLLQIFRLPYQQQKLACFHGKMDEQLPHYIAKQLYYQVPKWMKRQAEAYEKGENLLTQDVVDFYPQIRPPQSQIGFVQVTEDTTVYNANFLQYYQKQGNKTRQILYPPAFYSQQKTGL